MISEESLSSLSMSPHTDRTPTSTKVRRGATHVRPPLPIESESRLSNFFILIFPHWPSDLNALQEELRDSGFVILGFPSNQFGKQEPGAPAEILTGLK